MTTSEIQVESFIVRRHHNPFGGGDIVSVWEPTEMGSHSTISSFDAFGRGFFGRVGCRRNEAIEAMTPMSQARADAAHAWQVAQDVQAREIIQRAFPSDAFESTGMTAEFCFRA